ncbi:type IX secretion system histidine kinase PorY [Rhodohalobacter sp. 614A]|uniref:sensor histidine kinase n=1 Tax=Rhodohalobacter sp. 614A TaxID=2908649 RepID=UPI001F437F92|nr:HAMP domain-containing sensor histidine kinase [Rhodohalobacter sp. 614A]
MKLLNRSLQYLSVTILVVVGIWSVIFYLDFRDEVYDIVDDSLEDQLELLNARVRENPSLLETTTFENGVFSISPITEQEALVYQEEVFSDELMPLPYDNDLEQVRMLSEAYLVDGKYYKYQVISSTVEEDDLIESLFWFIVWLYMALILTIIVVNNWVLRGLWSPFYQILTELKQFRLEKKTNLANVSSRTREFQELKKVAEELIERTTQTFINQKQFTENASHELQTPIAIIRSKLELLIEKGTLADEDAKTVGEVLDITSRLTQLNKSLLLLSRIDNKQFAEDKYTSVNEMVHQIVHELDEISSYKNISINITENSSATMYADPYLAKILFQNLLVNAIHHNKKGGKVDIEISEKEFKICNTSNTKALDEKQLFKRFSKNRETKNSTGLGLAIVHAICNLYEFDIEYSYNELHCFQVFL